MNHWIEVTIAIEGFFAVAIVAALVTGRLRIVFAAGFNVMAVVGAMHLWSALPGPRSVVAAVMLGLYLARLNWVILFWTGTTALSKLDASLPKAGKLGLAFVLTNFVGFGYALPFWYVARGDQALDAWTWAALGVYAVGSALHFGSDFQKRRFKHRDDSKGKVLDTGLWSISRHPNYFGDFLVYVSFALVAANPIAWVSPALNLLQYLFDAIPKNERWAAEKYGDDWERYAKRTSMFVPWPQRD